MQHKPELRRSQIHWLSVWLLLASSFLAADWTRAETGVPAWVQRYGHVGDSRDETSQAVTDSADNVMARTDPDSRRDAMLS